MQDRYARTSIRNSTCDAVPQGSVLGPTRPLKLEPNHDVARLCGRSLVERRRSTETPIDSTQSPFDSSRFALALPRASRSPSFFAHRLQCMVICLPSFFNRPMLCEWRIGCRVGQYAYLLFSTLRYVTLTLRYVTSNEVVTLRYVML